MPSAIEEENMMHRRLGLDNEEILSAEWEIGGSAMTTDAIRAFVASE